jgi:hypothetical protein
MEAFKKLCASVAETGAGVAQVTPLEICFQMLWYRQSRSEANATDPLTAEPLT